MVTGVLLVHRLLEVVADDRTGTLEVARPDHDSYLAEPVEHARVERRHGVTHEVRRDAEVVEQPSDHAGLGLAPHLVAQNEVGRDVALSRGREGSGRS